MARKALVEVGSRWQMKNDPKGRVFFVYEKGPFGRLMFKQEDRAVTGESKQAEFLRNFVKLEGTNDSLSQENLNREAHMPAVAAVRNEAIVEAVTIYCALSDGIDAAFRQGAYKGATDVPACPHTLGSHDHKWWIRGFDYGSDCLAEGIDPDSNEIINDATDLG